MRWFGTQPFSLRRRRRRPSGDEIEALKRTAHALTSIGAGPARRSLVVGQRATHEGREVELLRIDLYERGAKGFFRVRWTDLAAAGWLEPAAFIGPVPEVHDDVGSAYEVFSSGWSGEPTGLSAEFVVTPAPPSAANYLYVDIPPSFRVDLHSDP